MVLKQNKASVALLGRKAKKVNPAIKVRLGLRETRAIQALKEILGNLDLLARRAQLALKERKAILEQLAQPEQTLLS